jgi:hypothetical protein
MAVPTGERFSFGMTYGLIAICPYILVVLILALELFLSCCGYQLGVVFRLSLGRWGGPRALGGENSGWIRGRVVVIF